MSWKNGHWPDCYVNNGPPDSTCDMGPGCGTVAPDNLTDEMVRALRDSAHPNGDGLDPNHAPDRALASDIAWHFASHVPDKNKRQARQRICDAINAAARSEK